MATECRKRRKVNRHTLVNVEAICVLIGLVLIGWVIGYLIGKSHCKVETVTVTETIEVPCYEADRLPEVSDVFLFDVPLSDSLQRYMYEVCADEEVPVTLILAMIEHESSFNPEAISRTEDYGLLQINKINHEQMEEQYRAADMLNPYQNIFCGVKIIGSYLAKYDGDITSALMSYNMGDYGARKARENGVSSTPYTEVILSIMEKYEEIVNGNKSE